MKKLTKRMMARQDTVQAFIAGCTCSCGCGPYVASRIDESYSKDKSRRDWW